MTTEDLIELKELIMTALIAGEMAGIEDAIILKRKEAVRIIKVLDKDIGKTYKTGFTSRLKED